MKRPDIWSGIFWLLLSVYISTHSLKLGLGSLHNPGPGFLFFWCGVTLGGLSMIVLVSAFPIGKTNAGERRKGEFENVNWIKVISVILGMTAYALILEKLGFLISTALLIGFLLRSIEAKRWYVVVFVALASSFLSYALFDLWLHTRLPKGFLGI